MCSSLNVVYLLLFLCLEAWLLLVHMMCCLFVLFGSCWLPRLMCYVSCYFSRVLCVGLSLLVVWLLCVFAFVCRALCVVYCLCSPCVVCNALLVVWCVLFVVCCLVLVRVVVRCFGV